MTSDICMTMCAVNISNFHAAKVFCLKVGFVRTCKFVISVEI